MSELSVKEERFRRRRCLRAIYVDSTKPRAEDAAAVVINEVDFEEGTEGIVLSCAEDLRDCQEQAIERQISPTPLRRWTVKRTGGALVAVQG